MAYESKHSIYKAVDFLVVCPDAAQRVYDHCLCDTITGFFKSLNGGRTVSVFMAAER